MNFIKGLLGYGKDQILENFNSDLKESKFFCSSLTMKSVKEEKVIFPECQVSIVENEKEKFNYNIYLIGANGKEYFFPIIKKTNIRYYKQGSSTIFQWDIEGDNVINMRLDQGDTKFHNFICKCLYINENKSSFNHASNDQIYNLCQMFDNLDVDSQNHKEELSILLTKINEDPKTLICYSGGFFQNNEQNQFVTIDDNVAFAIVKNGDYLFDFRIVGLDNKIKYEKPINTELNYHLDADDAIFKWIDTSIGIKLFAIKFHSFEASHSVKVLFARCLFEATRKENLETVLKGEEETWGNRYLNQEIEVEQEEGQSYPDLEFGSQIQSNSEKEFSEANNFFTQGKAIDRTFVSRGNIISVYKEDEDDSSLKHIVNLPVVKTLDGEDFMPKKAMMHEEDTKMLLLRADNDHYIYYYDIEKGKVVEEYQIDDYNRVKDISGETKHSELTQNKIFLTLNEKNFSRLTQEWTRKIQLQVPRLTL